MEISHHPSFKVGIPMSDERHLYTKHHVGSHSLRSKIQSFRNFIQFKFQGCPKKNEVEKVDNYIKSKILEAKLAG